MKESKLTLDFDQKSLIIPDDQIKQLPKVEKPVEIDLSDTKLGEGQKQKLKDLFNGFKGLFSDHPGLTHVLYHEIDTGDKGPVVSKPYRYDRVKQGIIDYHIEKMLQDGPYPAPRPERYRFLLVITNHFTKWSELITLRKASDQAIANARFENYISRYGAPTSLISDNGSQFISEVFEHLSHSLDIKYMKTVTYRPQANLTERVNRNLVQMIACFVEENHENWDRFLHEFAFALRTSVNETTNKTPAE
ncbi:retrovirus-related Pol polyprotein from transposon 297 [Trichonephila clavipes]|nr:retrovirus-related Pol polyprotein from transposon 297 [Trichonephila clavipes]